MKLVRGQAGLEEAPLWKAYRGERGWPFESKVGVHEQELWREDHQEVKTFCLGEKRER